MKTYKVEWCEYHEAIVKANNEEEAREKAQLKNPSETYCANDTEQETITEIN